MLDGVFRDGDITDLYKDGTDKIIVSTFSGFSKFEASHCFSWTSPSSFDSTTTIEYSILLDLTEMGLGDKNASQAYALLKDDLPTLASGGSIPLPDLPPNYSACITRRCRNVDLGDLDWEPISGTTITWNQLVQNGNFADTSGWNYDGGGLVAQNNELTLTIKNTTRYNALYRYLGFTPTVGHKYLVRVSMKSSRGTYGFTIAVGASNYTPYFSLSADEEKQIEYIVDSAVVDNNYLYAYFLPSEFQIGDTIKFKDFQVFDLTAMFGAPDEPSMDEFKRYFPEAYYPYDAGTQKRFATAFKGALQKAAKTVGMSEVPSLYCDSYKTDTPHNASGFESDVISTSADGNDIYVSDPSFSTKSDAEAKTYLAGKKCTYALESERCEHIEGSLMVPMATYSVDDADGNEAEFGE